MTDRFRFGRLLGLPAAAALVCAFLVTGAAGQTLVTPSKVDVTPNGAASYSVPITVPAGTAGMAPALSLEYSSQLGDGMLGMGWALSGLAEVDRCPQTIAQDGAYGGITYGAGDRFCLDGQRLIVISGTYGADGAEYRTEVESFTRVISHGATGSGPTWFEVHTKSGQILELGNTADSRSMLTGIAAVRSWLVDKISDTAGNYLTFIYDTSNAANGEVVPAEIDYTGNAAAGLGPYASVKLVYSTRPDPSTLYSRGAPVQRTKLLNDVQTYSGTTLVADYKLAYQQSPTMQRSRLASLTQCDGGSAQACLPPTSFGWTDGDGASFANFATFSASGNYAGYTFETADVNGDGRADLVAMQGTATAWNVSIAFSNGDGTFQAPVSWTDAGYYPNRTLLMADVDGDGKADLVSMGGDSTHWGAAVGLSNGDGTFRLHGFSASGNFAGYTFLMADINGDGRADMVATIGTTTAWTVYVALSNGDGTFQPPILWSAAGYTSTRTFLTGDVDGDGRGDLVSTGADTTHWAATIELSNGDGTFRTHAFSASGNFAGYTFALADVNGDGLADLIAIDGTTTSLTMYVALSNGDGTFQAPILWTDTGYYATRTLLMADANGDGKADLVTMGGDTTYWRASVGVSKGDGTFAQHGWSVAGNYAGYTFVAADVSGDGRADLVAMIGDASHWGAAVEITAPQPFVTLSSITTGLYATTAIAYKPLTDGTVYTKGTGAAYPVVDVQSPLYVVSQVQAPNGLGGTYAANYAYGGLQADLSGRGLLGFATTTVTDPQTNIVQTTSYRQDFPYLGLIASQIKTLGSLTLNSVTNSYAANNLGATRNFVYQTRNVTASTDLDGTALPTTTTTYGYDCGTTSVPVTPCYGNVTTLVATTPDGARRTTTNTYTNDATNWLLGRLISATVTSITP